jgi:hypothetical protein
MDQNVRYAMVVFGVANTGAVLIITRTELFARLSGAGLLVTRVVAVLYMLAAFMIMMDAIRSLRPRLSPEDLARLGMSLPTFGPGSTVRALLAMLPTGVEHPSLPDLHRAWQRMSGEELSQELSMVFLVSKGQTDVKYSTLRRLYTSVAMMLVLVGLLVSALGVASAI